VKVEGSKEFDAPRETVWGVINDPEQMAGLMPGVEGFELKDERHWRAKVKIPLGLGGLRMTIDFEKLEERPLEFASLKAKGNGVGAIMNMTTSFTLGGEGGHTSMQWVADVNIAGPVGSMGQRVLQPIVNQQVGQVLAALERQVESAAGSTGGGSASPATGSPGPLAAEVAEGDAPPPPGATGTEGAEEGIHPASPEAYDNDPQGPTQSA
jgi:carbon monoxide dehydrogenase subunit G